MIAIRGAITIENDTKEEVFKASKELIQEIVKRNSIDEKNIISIITTCTKDIRSAYPGPGIRDANIDVPILSMQEMDVEGALNLCIRFILHVDKDIVPKHVYLKKAVGLRPDYKEDN
ncbi:chorismate mutase [Ezakiella coagulans]|uniref:chorismate mutase n=1 Tax=Ezakiella coagulans TaxID=46507 RepID=A0A2U1E2Y0_9FIRM|nr:chorismate mutase [Ezakiella coagulans]PVY94192.1 chorismate mutase [Ezakiella coagulans]